jgi:hypothetical protein
MEEENTENNKSDCFDASSSRLRKRVNSDVDDLPKVLKIEEITKQQRNFLIYYYGTKSEHNPNPLSTTELARRFNVSERTARTWRDKKGVHVRKKRVEKAYKLTRKMAEFIKTEAGNNLTCIQNSSISDMTAKINNNFTSTHISRTTTARYLKRVLTKPRKIKKSFELTEENIKQRFEFCKNVIENNIKADQIFFTDEKKFYLKKPVNKGTNYIRLTKEYQRRLEKGDPEVEKLISSDMPKYSKSFMIAGGVTANGVGKLIFCAGNIDSNAYHKIIDYYNEDMKFIKSDEPGLLLQQDNAPCHVSHDSKAKIEEKFFKKVVKEDNYINGPPKCPKKPKDMSKETYKGLKEQYQKIKAKHEEKNEEYEYKVNELNKNQRIMAFQWPPNSPDLNPIETIWAFMEQEIDLIRHKGKLTIDQLKRKVNYIWNRIPKKLCLKVVSKFNDLVKTVYANNGNKENRKNRKEKKKLKTYVPLRVKFRFHNKFFDDYSDDIERIAYSKKTLKDFKDMYKALLKKEIAFYKKVLLLIDQYLIRSKPTKKGISNEKNDNYCKESKDYLTNLIACKTKCMESADDVDEDVFWGYFSKKVKENLICNETLTNKSLKIENLISNNPIDQNMKIHDIIVRVKKDSFGESEKDIKLFFNKIKDIINASEEANSLIIPPDESCIGELYDDAQSPIINPQSFICL